MNKLTKNYWTTYIKQVQKKYKNKITYSKYMTDKIINRGTGAGGARTNQNGLPYEKITDLSTEYEIISDNENRIIKFKNSSKNFININKYKFIKYMEYKKEPEINLAHGCKQPDECYIDEDDKIIYIIEKKFQQSSGSVCEKIQTAGFKKQHYNKIYPNYNIEYIYCLSDYFKKGFEPELEYLKTENIPVFWGKEPNYKENIIKFITKQNMK